MKSSLIQFSATLIHFSVALIPALLCLATASNVITDISVAWPEGVTFEKIAPWLTEIKLYSGEKSTASLELSADGQASLSLIGAGYILFPKDGSIVSGVDNAERKLQAGDKIALIVSSETSEVSNLLDSMALIVEQDKFCENITSMLSVKKKVQRGVFCGQVSSFSTARNGSRTFSIHGISVPAKPGKE